MSAPRKPKADPVQQLVGPAPVRNRGGSQSRTPELEAVIGARIRAARVAARMNKTALGKIIGVSFQQIRKYENGKDRVAASTLGIIAEVLGVNPGSFYVEDPSWPEPSSKRVARSSMTDLRNAQRIGERIEQLGDPVLTRSLMALVDVMLEARSGLIESDSHEPDEGT